MPIGLINSSWRGTDVAAWTSLSAQQSVDAIITKFELYDSTIAAFYPADAKIDIATGRLVLSNKKVQTPAAARYNGAKNPHGNVM